MSCVVGIAYRGTVWIGGDRFTHFDGAAGEKSEPKVARVGAYLIGSAGDGRYGQIIRHCFVPPPRRRGRDLLAYLAADFVGELQVLLTRHGLVPAYLNESRAASLIGVDGRLFCLLPSMHVVEQARGYDAIGTGARQALGALYPDPASTLTPRGRVVHALVAAADLTSSVRAPFDVFNTNGSKS